MKVTISRKNLSNELKSLEIYARTFELWDYGTSVGYDLSTNKENFPLLIAYLKKNPYVKNFEKDDLVIRFSYFGTPVNIFKQNKKLDEYFDTKTQNALSHPEKFDPAVKVYATDLGSTMETKIIRGTLEYLQQYGISIQLEGCKSCG